MQGARCSLRATDSHVRPRACSFNRLCCATPPLLQSFMSSTLPAVEVWLDSLTPVGRMLVLCFLCFHIDP